MTKQRIWLPFWLNRLHFLVNVWSCSLGTNTDILTFFHTSEYCKHVNSVKLMWRYMKVMLTVQIFGQTRIVTFTVLGHFQSSYKAIFGHLYLVMLTILNCDIISLLISAQIERTILLSTKCLSFSKLNCTHFYNMHYWSIKIWTKY